MRLPRRSARGAIFVLTFAAAAALACGGNSAEGTPPDTGPRIDGGAGEPDSDAGALPLCFSTGTRSTGSTFTELYQDYFGDVGHGGCAGNGRCHGSADQPGSLGSNGFVCPSRNDNEDDDGGENEPNGKDTCYQQLRNAGLVTAADRTAPEHAKLYTVLRKSTGGGTMPKAPVCAFDGADMKRIADWIRAGAPDN